MGGMKRKGRKAGISNWFGQQKFFRGDKKGRIYGLREGEREKEKDLMMFAEDQIIFFGKSGAGKKGEESSSSPSPKGGKSPIPKLVASKAEEDEERGGGKAEGNFQDAWSKLEDKQGNDDVIEEACEAQDESLASNGEIGNFTFKSICL